MLPVVFGPAARAELIEARNWCRARGAELTARFAAEIETVVERIARAPQHFPVVHRDVRRARCRRFPSRYSFGVHKHADAGVPEAGIDGSVHVIACFHSRRDPHQWQRRS